MSGKICVGHSGIELEDKVAELATDLGLKVQRQVEFGRRIWGAKRKVDVVLTHPVSGESLGVECKMQDQPGSAEEKILATIQDIRAWPIKGVVVFGGNGFSANMRSYLYSTGMALELEQLDKWLRFHFRMVTGS